MHQRAVAESIVCALSMKVILAVGTRPNFVKAAPILAAIREHNVRVSRGRSNGKRRVAEPIQPILVHTGQHYDQGLSARFFSDFDLPNPDVNLGVGSASHAVQTAEIMKRFERVVLRERPDVVVVVGDVNSTLACALVTAKISFDAVGTRPLIAHVEAGLRSFDRTMPEECNRILTDHVVDIFFVSEPSGVRNLLREGIAAERLHFVGNTMIDSLLAYRKKAESSAVLNRLRLQGSPGSGGLCPMPYSVLTLHRSSNVDDPQAFKGILQGLQELASEMPIIFPVHPKTQQRIKEFALEEYFDAGLWNARAAPPQGAAHRHTRLVPPLGYIDFLCLMKHARLVITDSGGIQEETTGLGIPCVTVRENTERPITVRQGSNVVAGVAAPQIQSAIRRQLKRRSRLGRPDKWDGKAAFRILKVLSREARKNRRGVCVGGACPTY